MTEEQAMEIAMEALNKLSMLGLVALDSTTRRIAKEILSDSIHTGAARCAHSNEVKLSTVLSRKQEPKGREG